MPKAYSKAGKGKKEKAASPVHPEELPTGASELPKSSSTQERLDELVMDGVLPPQPVLQWIAPDDDFIPWGIDRTRQLVFRWMFLRGFGLPCCSFLRGLLFFYGLELVNLSPNSLLHIVLFIHLCEAFLGVRPHFKLFQQLFYLRPLPTANSQQAIGGVGLQLRKNASYFAMPFASTFPHWRKEWFVCDNPEPSLPEYTAQVAEPQENWNPKDPGFADDDEVKTLMEKIAELKAQGVTGSTILFSMVSRGVQPAKRQEKPAWTYSRGDITREVPDPVVKEAVLRRVEKMVVNIDPEGVKHIGLAYNASKERHAVSNACRDVLDFGRRFVP